MKGAEWTLIGNSGAESEVSVPPEGKNSEATISPDKKDPSTSVKPSGYHAKPLDKAELIDHRRSYQGPEGWTVLVPDPSNKTGGR